MCYTNVCARECMEGILPRNIFLETHTFVFVRSKFILSSKGGYLWLVYMTLEILLSHPIS